MNEKNNGKGVFYGVIGVATLVVAIIGATFAYFTASASNNNQIKGNMATVELSLAVSQVSLAADELGGMIPMSNGMVEEAVNSDNQVCVDDNGNAVCQIYQITLTNSSTAGQFVDGYVALRYGSGIPTDYSSYKSGAKFVNETKTADAANGVGTTMRWAQIFEGKGNATTNNAVVGDYSTAGTQVLGADNETIALDQIGAEKETAGDSASVKLAKAQNTANIRDVYATTTDNATKGILGQTSIAGSTYKVIGKNYIRVSNHDWTTTTGKQTYTRDADVTSALVFNHSVAAGKSATYYIVVWLSETGTNQTAGATVKVDEDTSYKNPAAINFFDGNVTFISAEGSEVSATFAGYARVAS